MKRRVEEWTVEKLFRDRTRISFPEYQREKALWTTEKKSLLIDSILRDIDIPKLYFNRLKDKSIEVVDGQQRLWSIWQFLDDEFAYQGEGAKRTFSKLSPSQQQKITDYVFQVTVFEEADDDYLRLLFVRLQLGLLLNTGERLHAATGKMKQLVFDKLARHPFIQHLGVLERRFVRETLCAQIAINSFSRQKLREFARTRYDDLEHFFDEYADPQGKDLDFFRVEAKKIKGVLDQLWECFGPKSKEFKNRSYILSMYLLLDELVGDGTLSQSERKEFANFVTKLWGRLREEKSMGMDRRNRELYTFETLISSAPGEAYQIERRHTKLLDYFAYFRKTGKIKGD